MRRFTLGAALAFGLVFGLGSSAFAVNVIDKNPIFYDTAGATSAITSQTAIIGIIVNPTAAAWAVVIHDAASGDVVFKTQDNLQAPVSISFPGGLIQSGLYATTLTNAEVLVYTE